jgi:hypothetical protein
LEGCHIPSLMQATNVERYSPFSSRGKLAVVGSRSKCSSSNRSYQWICGYSPMRKMHDCENHAERYVIRVLMLNFMHAACLKFKERCTKIHGTHRLSYLFVTSMILLWTTTALCRSYHSSHSL